MIKSIKWLARGKDEKEIRLLDTYKFFEMLNFCIFFVQVIDYIKKKH